MLQRALPCSRQAQAPSQLGQAGHGQWRAPSALPCGRGEGEGLNGALAWGAGAHGLETMLVEGKACLWHGVHVLAVLGIFSRGSGPGDAPCLVPGWRPTARYRPQRVNAVCVLGSGAGRCVTRGVGVDSF